MHDDRTRLILEAKSVPKKRIERQEKRVTKSGK